VAGLAAVLVVFLGAFSALLIVRWTGDALARAPEPSAPEQVPFAGGKPPRMHAWSRYHVRYYAMSLLFLAFDMEMVFMYPWAVVFLREGMVALVEMLMFILILVLGVLYAWRERAFEWA
jgi:NADH:ubiquinone oxidoreductase subunit 3 (subunit A)